MKENILAGTFLMPHGSFLQEFLLQCDASMVHGTKAILRLSESHIVWDTFKKERLAENSMELGICIKLTPEASEDNEHS